jgi:hypothetical protein
MTLSDWSANLVTLNIHSGQSGHILNDDTSVMGRVLFNKASKSEHDMGACQNNAPHQTKSKPQNLMY